MRYWRNYLALVGICVLLLGAVFKPRITPPFVVLFVVAVAYARKQEQERP